MNAHRISLAVMAGSCVCATYADNGTVNLTSGILQPTCGLTAPVITVELPLNVQTADLAKPGQRAGFKAFPIEFTGCYNYTAIRPIFDQNSLEITSGGRLRVTGTAKSVEIELTSADGTVPLNLKLGDYNVKAALLNGGGKATFGAQYYSLGNTTAGTANATISFSLLYE